MYRIDSEILKLQNTWTYRYLCARQIQKIVDTWRNLGYIESALHRQISISVVFPQQVFRKRRISTALWLNHKKILLEADFRGDVYKIP